MINGLNAKKTTSVERQVQKKNHNSTAALDAKHDIGLEVAGTAEVAGHGPFWPPLLHVCRPPMDSCAYRRPIIKVGRT
jgi:hypothetical protein